MTTKTCPQCHKEFEIKKYINITAYCSKQCQRRHAAEKRNRKTPRWMIDIDEMIKVVKP